MQTKRITTVTTRGISLPLELDERLVAQAAEEERPVSWVIRRALAVYLGDGPAEKATEEVRRDQR